MEKEPGEVMECHQVESDGFLKVVGVTEEKSRRKEGKRGMARGFGAEVVMKLVTEQAGSCPTIQEVGV